MQSRTAISQYMPERRLFLLIALLLATVFAVRLSAGFASHAHLKEIKFARVPFTAPDLHDVSAIPH